VVGGFAAAIDHLGKESKYTIQEMTKIVLDSVDVSKNDLTKWYVNGYDVRALNTKLGLGEIGIQCVKNAHGMWNGGNQWSGWISYISFFRYIAKLDIDYSKWDCYEKLAELSGPRLVHKSFCIICDRPSVLTVDAQNRPHNDTGPFTKWSDGCGMYSVHNVRVPAYIIEKPERITVELIEAEQNAEVRRVMIDKYGREKFIVDSKSEVVHQDDFGTLYVKKLAGDEDMMMVKVVNSTPEPDGTFKDYFIRCDPKAYGGLKTAQAAVASTWRKSDGSMLFEKPEDYDPAVET
jgi:hypothetical protein